MDSMTVRKWFRVWDFDKEERWLNEMALSGWVLTGVGWSTYHFAACEKGEYTIRLEMHEHDQAYLDFMAETGAEYIGRIAQWIYFRKRSELGAFDLFSDIDSRIAHLDRIGKMLLIIGLANLCCGLAMPNYITQINLLCCALLMYALGRIRGKKEALEKERLLRE